MSKDSNQIEELKEKNAAYADEIAQYEKNEQVRKQELKPSMRSLKGERKIFHDLFILKPIKVRKNMSFHEGEENAVWVYTDHKHHFHTCNSKGKKLIHCAPGNGHYHEVVVEEKTVKDENGDEQKILVATCGPALVKHKGKSVAYRYDQHTHETEYVFSEELVIQQANPDAVRVMNYLAAEETAANSNVAGMLA
jgi:hypothetical protein